MLGYVYSRSQSMRVLEAILRSDLKLDSSSKPTPFPALWPVRCPRDDVIVLTAPAPDAEICETSVLKVEEGTPLSTADQAETNYLPDRVSITGFVAISQLGACACQAVASLRFRRLCRT